MESLAPLEAGTYASGAMTARREVLLRQAAAVSAELRRAARQSRAAQLQSMPRPSRVGRLLKTVLNELRGARSAAAWSFLALCVVPALLGIVYWSLVASDQYIAETRFAVRAGERAPIDALASVGLATIRQAQDSLIVLDYVKSRAIVDELDKRVGLRNRFAHRDIDLVSRFAADDSIESLVRYWRGKVKTAVESTSGIVTVEVRAFSPQDSLDLARGVFALSEELVNNLSERSRRDMVSEAQKNLSAAEARLKTVLTRMRDWRNETGIIDPRKQAEGVNKIIDDLKQDRITLEQQINATRNLIAENAPQTQLTRARIRAIDRQIDMLQRRLTAPESTDTPTIAGAIVQFDRLELERRVAEAQYAAAAVAFERASTAIERQIVYLSPVVEPVLPQESLYPHRLWFALATAAAAFVAWMLGFGAWTTASRHLR